MSNRALIARRITNGYFSAWCWINGEPGNMGEILRAYFTSDEYVDELVSYKSILGIFKDPSDDNNKNIDGSYKQLKNGFYVKYDDGEKTVVSGGRDGFFPTITIMMNEYVQFVYIYDDGKWITYRRE